MKTELPGVLAEMVTGVTEKAKVAPSCRSVLAEKLTGPLKPLSAVAVTVTVALPPEATASVGRQGLRENSGSVDQTTSMVDGAT